MMNWQKLIRDLPRDSGDNGSNGENSNGGQGVNSGQQEQGPGLGLNDSFGMQPGEQGPSMGSMNFGGPTVSDALGDTSLGSFGFNGITSNSLDVTSPFSGTPTAPEAVPGYEGPGPTVSGTQFDSMAPTVDPANPPSVLDTLNDVPSSFKSTPDKALGFDAQNAANALSKDAEFSDIGNLGAQAASSSLGKSGAAQSQANANEVAAQEIADASDKDKAKAEMQAVSEDKASREAKEMADKASKEAIDRALAGLVEAPAAIGVNPATTPTSAPSTIGSTTKSNDVTPSTTPTADSSTSKGPGTTVTGLSLIDGFLSSVMNNPVSAVTNAVVGVVGGPFGLANSISGIMGGPTIGGLVSGAVGTGSGYGNTVTSSSEKGGFSPGNNPGGGPSTSDNFGGGGGNDGGGGGGNSGGGITSILEPTAVLPKKTDPASTFVDYDLAKSPTAAPKYTYPDYGVYSYPDVTAPQGASFSDNYALQFPVIPEYPNLSNTNQGILDAFPVYTR